MRGREGGWGLRCAITLGALQRVRYMKQKGMDTDVAMASEEDTAVGQLLAAEGINGVKLSEGATTVSGHCSACAT